MRGADRPLARRALSRWADLPLRGKGLVVVALPLGALLVAALALSVVLWEGRQAEASADHAREVRTEIQLVLTLLVDAETGVRGYVLSGRQDFLDPYATAQQELPTHLAHLGALVQDRPAQAARLRRVEALAGRRFDALAELHAHGHRPFSRPPDALLLTGKQTMDALRAELAGMQDEEERVLAARAARAAAANRRATATIAASVLVGVVGGFAASSLFAAGIVRRAYRLEENAHLLARGHPLVGLPAGDDELGRVGRALGQAADLLGAREAALTASLRRLAEQTRALEAKTREQDAFLYTVSHDLRAPLVSLQVLAGMLAEDYGARLDGEGRRYIERLSANAARMQTLLDDLLELARVGRDERADEAVDLGAVVAQVVEQLQQTLRARGAEVRVAGALPTVRGNRTRLAQVFANLIDNAVQYTPPGRDPVVGVGAVDRGDAWELAVRDNGVGIPPEYREKAFGLFQRLPAGKALNAGGSGAGLAIVARIVEAHGGRCWLESTEGAGTTVRFTLPKGGAGAAGGTAATPAGEVASV